MELPEELKASILADVTRVPSPTGPQLRRREYVVLALCGALAVVGLFAMERLIGARANPVGRPLVYIVVATAAFVVLAVLATMMAFPRKSMVGPPRAWMLSLAFGAPLVVLGVLLALNVGFEHTRAMCVNAAGNPRIGFVCLDVTLILGAFPVLALLFARRAGLSVRPVETGLGIGLSVGAWTGVGVTLTCECTNSTHVAIGHVLPVIALAALGGFIAYVASRRANRSPRSI